MRKTPNPKSDLPADAHLWRTVAESARPLKQKRGRPIPARENFSKSAEISKKEKIVAPKPESKSPPPPALHPGAAPGVDGGSWARLRNGDMPIDATLDLHGYTQNEAHSALIATIAQARALGLRCVCVVTGKGGKEGADGRTTGVLRANVPRWLNEPPLRVHVLAFANAQPRHGGEGALYVLVKRARETRPR